MEAATCNACKAATETSISMRTRVLRTKISSTSVSNVLFRSSMALTIAKIVLEELVVDADAEEAVIVEMEAYMRTANPSSMWLMGNRARRKEVVVVALR